MDLATAFKPLPSLAAIRCFAELSALAYAPYPDQALPGLSVSVVSTDGVDALLVSDDSRLVIAFRGTEWNWREWLRNFAAFPAKEALPALFHSGYYEGIRGIFGLLIESMRSDHGIDASPGGSWKRISLCGHSQGGALCGVLLAAALPVRNVANVCVFNAPSFCGRTEATVLEKRLLRGDNGSGTKFLRVSLSNDVVSRIPAFFRNPQLPVLPTRHRFAPVGAMAHLSNAGDLMISPSKPQTRFRRWADFKIDVFRDHSIERTRKALNNAKLSIGDAAVEQQRFLG